MTDNNPIMLAVSKTAAQKAAEEFRAAVAATYATATAADKARAKDISKSGKSPTKELITPAIAAVILTDHNVANRDALKSSSTIISYKNQMLNGQWEEHHQGFGFYTDGTLADGQHRCYAMVMSGKSFNFVCTSDVKKQAIAMIDNGKPRKADAFLELEGVSDATKKAGIAEAIMLYAYQFANDGKRTRFINTEVIDFVKSNNAMLTRALEIGKSVSRVSDAPLTAMQAAKLAAQYLSGGHSESFIVEALLEIQRGEAPYSDCPTTTFGRVMQKSKNARDVKDRVAGVSFLALGVKALQLRAVNRTATKLAFNPKKEPIPDFRAGSEEAAAAA
jgi:hypothetical protein